MKVGDTLYKIASTFGVSVKSIQQLNGMGTSTTILAGRKLLIPTSQTSSTANPTPSPSPTQRTYTVKAGDNLTSIARKFGVTATAIARLNNITNPNNIKVNDVLKIPG